MFRIILMALSFIGIVNAGSLENGTYTESFDNGNPKYEISYKNKFKIIYSIVAVKTGSST